MIRAVLLALALSGCTVVGHVKVDDCPPMKVVEHHVSVGAMLEQCYTPLPLWMKAIGSFPFACASLRFQEQRCDIYVVANSDDVFLEHERLHCACYDHVGSTGIKDAITRWRAGK